MPPAGTGTRQLAVSAASLPLPSGAATETTLAAVKTAVLPLMAKDAEPTGELLTYALLVVALALVAELDLEAVRHE